MKWQSPAVEKEGAFTKVHEAFYRRDPLQLPATCAVCEQASSCHIYCHRPQEGHDHGGGWIWCSACHSYAHFSMQIPEWWQNPDFIPFDRLQHDPEHLDAHAAAIDKHCEQLLVKENWVKES